MWADETHIGKYLQAREQRYEVMSENQKRNFHTARNVKIGCAIILGAVFAAYAAVMSHVIPKIADYYIMAIAIFALSVLVVFIPNLGAASTSNFYPKDFGQLLFSLTKDSIKVLFGIIRHPHEDSIHIRYSRDRFRRHAGWMVIDQFCTYLVCIAISLYLLFDLHGFSWTILLSVLLAFQCFLLLDELDRTLKLYGIVNNIDLIRALVERSRDGRLLRSLNEEQTVTHRSINDITPKDMNRMLRDEFKSMSPEDVLETIAEFENTRIHRLETTRPNLKGRDSQS